MRQAILALALITACKDKPATPAPGAPPTAGSAAAPANAGPAGSGSAGSASGSAPGSASTGSGGSGSATAEVMPLEAGPAPKSEPGAAYVAIKNGGIVKIDDGKVTQVSDKDAWMQDALVTAQGDVIFTGIGSVTKLSGDKPRELRDKNSFQSWENMSAAPDGKLYFTSGSAAAMADGLAWTEFPKEPFGGELLQDVAVDGKGQVWIAGTYNLWRRDGEAWTKVSGTEAVGTDKPFFAALATDGAGRLYVSSNQGLHVFDGTSWRALTKGRIGSYDELLVRSDGMIAASGGMDDVFVSVPGGQSLNLDAERLGLSAKRIDVVALDGAGRIWLDTDAGLAMIDAKGNVTATWAPGTLPGVTGEITAVAVLGGGPVMPAAQAAITGAVVGKVLKGGQPVAGAPIEICESPSSMFRTTPCAEASIKFQSTTAADGTFRFEGVPATKMGFTIKPGAQWVAFWGDSGCCAKLTAGGTYDVGAITLDD